MCQGTLILKLNHKTNFVQLKFVIHGSQRENIMTLMDQTNSNIYKKKKNYLLFINVNFFFFCDNIYRLFVRVLENKIYLKATYYFYFYKLNKYLYQCL